MINKLGIFFVENEFRNLSYNPKSRHSHSKSESGGDRQYHDYAVFTTHGITAFQVTARGKYHKKIPLMMQIILSIGLI